MAEFKRIAETGDIAEGTGKPIEIGDIVIALFNLEGEFFAIDNTCPHRGASLGFGTIDGCKVICPLHNWEFDIKTGRMWKGEGVRTYPVEIRGESVWVEV